MRKSACCASALILMCLTSVRADPIIDVTVSVNTPLVNGSYLASPGETYTLSVLAQPKPAYANPNNGIFGWDVDLRVEDPTVLSLLPATLDRSGWTGTPSTSSNGTATAWGLDAIYDTGEGSMDLGVDGPVRLFSIDFQCLGVGQSALTIEPDAKSGADFVTWGGNTGGEYSNASVLITVVPEPASMSLLGAGAMALLWLCWRRFK